MRSERPVIAPSDAKLEKDRRKIDPEMRYHSPGLRAFEKQALAILKRNRDAKVARTRDLIQITLEYEPALVLFVTPEALEVRFPAVEWLATDRIAASSIPWQRREWAKTDEAGVKALLIEARRVLSTRTYGSQSFDLDAHCGAVMDACRQLVHGPRRLKHSEVRLSFADGILLVSMPHRGVGAPAKGSWPAEVITTTDFLYVYAEAPLTTETVHLHYEDGEVSIGGITVRATSARETVRG